MAHDSELGWALGVVFRSWQGAIEEVVGDLPHGPRGFQILSTLAVGDPPTQASLATHLGIDRTVLTYVLDDLAAAGLVERTADARDRRVRRLVLTASGRSRLKELRAGVAAAERTLFPGLSASESDALRGLLERAAAGMHSGEGTHDACRVVEDILADAAGGATAAGAA